MDGITILKTIEITETVELFPFANLCATVIAFVLIVISFCIQSHMRKNMENSFLPTFFAVMAIVCLIAGKSLGNAKTQAPTGCYQYECVIDESVNIEDVLEIYDYVDKKDGVWILRDKI